MARKEERTRQGEGGALAPVEEVRRLLMLRRAELADAEVALAEAEGAMDTEAAIGATQRIEMLRRFIRTLEAREKEACEVQARRDAEARLLGIRRAHGSLLASLEGDEQRIRDAVAAVEDALRRMNERYESLVRLGLEADALVDRFGLDRVEVPLVLPPARRDLDVTPSIALADHARPRPATESCEHGMRERRTYREIEGTDSYAIITAAGLPPWPALTERQAQIVAQREREQAEMEREAAGLARRVEAMTGAMQVFPGLTGASGL